MQRYYALFFTLAACTVPHGYSDTASEVGTPGACDWPQIFGTSDHSGRACPELHGLAVVSRKTVDPDAAAKIDSNGFLQEHPSSPLTLGDYVVTPTQRGFTDVFNESTVTYGISVDKWIPSVLAAGATLVHQWDADSDFGTVDGLVCSIGCMTNGYIQGWNAAIANGSVYYPAAHGRFERRSLATGELQARIDPFVGMAIDGDGRLIVNNAPMVMPDGSVVYTATAWPTDVFNPPTSTPFGKQPRGSWLVKLLPTNDFVVKDWAEIASPSVGVPRATDLCEYPFGTGGQNPLTGPTSKPPRFGCGTQRPALNAPVAYSAAINRMVVYSYANNARAAGFLIVLDPATLAPAAAGDLRNNDMLYGCGVRLGLDFPGCDLITAGGTVNHGVDPQFGTTIRLRTPADIMYGAPVVSPDGSLMGVCSYDGGFSFFGDFDARGSCIFYNTADGSFHSSNTDFGYDVTPTALPTAPLGLGFSWLQDRNLYSDGHLGVARYDQDNELQNTAEVPDFLFGDFVDTNITFGFRGDHYGFTEGGPDGARAYKIDATGHLVDSVQLTPDSIEVLPGPAAVDRVGRRYLAYAGEVIVVGSSGTVAIPLAPSRRSARVARLAAKSGVVDPGPPAD